MADMPQNESLAEDFALPVSDARKVFLALDIPLEIAAMLSSDHRVHVTSHRFLSDLAIPLSEISAVACPLISDQSDASQVIEDLEAMGFRGVLMVVAPKLPDPGMIQAELRRQAHKIKVTLISP